MSRRNVPRSATAVLENLEPRLLLDALDPTHRTVTLDDVDGDQVTVAVKGTLTSGEAVLSGADSHIDLVGTDNTTAVTVTIKKGKDGDGLALFQWIHADGDLKSLAAPAVWLSSADTGADSYVHIDGTVGALSLYGLYDGDLAIGGDATDAPVTLTFGSSLHAPTFQSGTPVKALTASDAGFAADAPVPWSAPSFGAITMKGNKAEATPGNLFAVITATAGGIGDIKLTGGDFVGSLIAENGSVGNLSATNLYTWDKEGLTGQVVGGRIAAEIRAGAVKGKSVGNITAAGNLDLAITGSGSVGNITATGLVFKSSMELNENDRLVAFSEFYPANTTLQIYLAGNKAGVGAIKVAGGNLAGSVSADAIGAVTVTGVAAAGEVQGGNLTADLTAVHTLGALSTVGGAIGSADAPVTLSAGGTVGAITSKGMKYLYDVGMNGYAPGGAFLDVDNVATVLGAITVTGGDMGGTINALKVANITVNCEAAPGFDGGEYAGGSLEAEITAVTSIGSLSAKGGTMTAALAARDGIGAVTLTGLKVDAKVTWWTDPGPPAMRFWESTEGSVFGGPMQVTIALGDKGDGTYNTKATLGAITGVGVEGSVEGTVPWAPSKAKVGGTALSYIPGYEGDPNSLAENPPPKAQDKATVGGKDPDGQYLLGNNLAIWPDLA